MKPFDIEEDDIVDDIGELHMVETRTSSFSEQQSKAVAQVITNEETNMANSS